MKCDELYILGERLNETPDEETPSTQMRLTEMLATSPGKKAPPKPVVWLISFAVDATDIRTEKSQRENPLGE